MSSLTPKQAAALRARLIGQSERAAARNLGVSRATFRDRVRGAVRKLRRANGQIPPLPDMSRRWAKELLDATPKWLKPRDRPCLLRYVDGETRVSIARSLKLEVRNPKLE